MHSHLYKSYVTHYSCTICSQVVLVAKHLCGVATDISLRSAATFSLLPSSPSSTSGDSGSSSSSGGGILSSQLRGVAIATCCHHACIWNDYVGASALNSPTTASTSQKRGELTCMGLTGTEFDVLKQWSG